MNTNSLKNIYEKMPKCIKFLFSSVFVRLMVNSSVFKKTYNEIEAYESLSTEEQEKITFNKLKDTLIYAYEKTDYYKRLFDSVGFKPYEMTSFDDIKSIPVLNRQIAEAEGSSLHSKDDIKYYESHTSGSSGKVFKILLDKDSIYKERAFVTHYQHKFGFDLYKSKTVAIWGHNKDSDYYYSPLKNEIVISPFRIFNEEDFEDVWNTIINFKPDVIAGYPSALHLLAKLVNKYKKSLSVKYIEFYAENYTQEIKKYVEKTFNCTAIARYGHTERAVFAELYSDGYKFNSLYGYTELIPMEDTENDSDNIMYKIICTGFLSKKMPLIRYETDDTAYFDKEGHLLINGHTTSESKVVASNGARIYKAPFMPHIAPFEKVKQYQYEQYEKGKVILNLVLDKPFTDEDYKILDEHFKRKLEGIVTVEVRIVDNIKLNKRGKYKWLISYLDEQNS